MHTPFSPLGVKAIGQRIEGALAADPARTLSPQARRARAARALCDALIVGALYAAAAIGLLAMGAGA